MQKVSKNIFLLRGVLPGCSASCHAVHYLHIIYFSKICNWGNCTNIIVLQLMCEQRNAISTHMMLLPHTAQWKRLTHDVNRKAAFPRPQIIDVEFLKRFLQRKLLCWCSNSWIVQWFYFWFIRSDFSRLLQHMFI